MLWQSKHGRLVNTFLKREIKKKEEFQRIKNLNEITPHVLVNDNIFNALTLHTDLVRDKRAFRSFRANTDLG